MYKRVMLQFVSRLVFVLVAAVILVPSSSIVHAQENPDPRASLFFSPKVGHFLVDSTFDVSIFINTDGQEINAVEVDIKFPPDKLQVVSPSTGQSFISIWTSQPTYSNTDGIISFSGGLPYPGINTSSGLISKITFRVKKPGTATLEFSDTSKILANDGRGTNILHTIERAVYTLASRPPEGPIVFSQTHPNETFWYNNNNPIINWESEKGTSGYSFILDQFSKTVPDNTSETSSTSTAFEDIKDGIWYFHIKARKSGVWGAPSHLPLFIDTTPPAEFRLEINTLSAAIAQKKLVSFFTTDSLSGMSHYEVAVIDKDELSASGASIFVEADSPYQLPRVGSGNVRVFVRAFDKAGNVREEFIDTRVEPTIPFLIWENKFLIIAILFSFLLTMWILWHEFFGHHIMARFSRGKRSLLPPPYTSGTI